MTLITVVCYDFVVFNHLKSHTFEKSTLSPCGYFMEIPARKKIVCIFCSALFTYVLKLHDVKIIYPIFAGTNVLSSAKTRTPANINGNFINRPICKIFALSRVVYTGFQTPFYG